MVVNTREQTSGLARSTVTVVMNVERPGSRFLALTVASYLSAMLHGLSEARISSVMRNVEESGEAETLLALTTLTGKKTPRQDCAKPVDVSFAGQDGKVGANHVVVSVSWPLIHQRLKQFALTVAKC